MKRKVCFINESRSEYGILYPLMKAVEKDRELELSIIVTNMHLSKRFGYTVKEIEQDGFNIDKRIPSIDDNCDDPGAMVEAFSKEVKGIKDHLLETKPDFVFIAGDRSPALAGAIAAAHLGIPVVHHSGGDITGAVIDESIRHAITRFAHLHLPMTEESAERLRKMGEEPWRMHVVGPLGIDALDKKMLPAKEKLAKEFNLDLKKPIILLIFHPVTLGSREENARQMRMLMNVVAGLKEQTIIVYPNSDSGGRAMIDIIKEYEHLTFIRSFKSIYFTKYMGLMSIATVMVGNSSGGLSESPYFSLPVIDIGDRQKGRERATNVVNVNPESEAISSELKKILYDEKYRARLKDCNNPFRTKEDPIKKILTLFKTTRIDDKLLVKRLTY